ncbi:hypothetical protein LWI28_013426 [Acer negundo]|uniref:Glycoside hydrolase family 3 N-terminal domain-containing protein n=1 Tax=Acer negundo TaxID=4023 RepID=A0AAD5NXB9_ACENE|nr:hypothetical protein LWI28_013426 [Acer negundo]
MIYGIDAVHGHSNVYKATIFPHNVGLGATRDPELVKRIGAATALEVRATNIPYVFGRIRDGVDATKATVKIRRSFKQ